MPREYLIEDMFDEIIDDINYIRLYSSVLLDTALTKK